MTTDTAIRPLAANEYYHGNSGTPLDQSNIGRFGGLLFAANNLVAGQCFHRDRADWINVVRVNGTLFDVTDPEQWAAFVDALDEAGDEYADTLDPEVTGDFNFVHDGGSFESEGWMQAVIAIGCCGVTDGRGAVILYDDWTVVE